MDEQKKYIDTDAIHDILASHFCACSDETEETLHSVWNELKVIPAADVQPVKHGRWIGVSPLVDTFQCSICGYNILDEEMKTPFCPWCGAYMH